MQDQSFQVLKLLLQQSGELVTRAEQRFQIRPDFDNRLNTSPRIAG
jgi:hypothetical protein